MRWMKKPIAAQWIIGALVVVASWYSLPGGVTASGEKYDAEALAAAHQTLPFNTMVLVERLDNGKSVLVRINDRGPYVEGRSIDLSVAAARNLDMETVGLARVALTVVGVSFFSHFSLDMK